MRKCLLDFNFGLASNKREEFTFQGTAQQMTKNYFTEILSSLHGDVSQILTYLMQGMGKFQELAVKEPNSRNCCQLVVLITARMVSPDFGIATMSLRYLVSSTETTTQVKKVNCKET
jgi:hypothetical protein